MLDSASNNPGLKAFEKLTAGVYLGQLCRLMLIAAADEGLISRAAGDGARQLRISTPPLSTPGRAWSAESF